MSGVTVEYQSDGMQCTRGLPVDIAFRSRGRGPAIILLHGTSASHAVWDPVAEQLAHRSTVICIDQRGHGRSGRSPGQYSGPDFAQDVINVLDALEIERAVVGGHSLGARNAWLSASLAPKRVTAVLAVDYTPYVESSVLTELANRVAGGDQGFATVAAVETYLRGRYPLLPTAATARRVRWGYRQTADGSWRALAEPAAMVELIAGLRTPHDKEFGAVASPMTHIRGARSRIVSPEAWATAQAARPQDRWVVDPKSDHYVPEENPALIAAELARLLDYR